MNLDYVQYLRLKEENKQKVVNNFAESKKNTKVNLIIFQIYFQVNNQKVYTRQPSTTKNKRQMRLKENIIDNNSTEILDLKGNFSRIITNYRTKGN